MKHFGSIVLLGVKFIKKMPSKRSHNANMKKLFDKPMPKLRLVNIKLTQVMPFTDNHDLGHPRTIIDASEPEELAIHTHILLICC